MKSNNKWYEDNNILDSINNTFVNVVCDDEILFEPHWEDNKIITNPFPNDLPHKGDVIRFCNNFSDKLDVTYEVKGIAKTYANNKEHIIIFCDKINF